MYGEILMGLVRHLLTTAGGAAVANGVLSSSDLTTVVGAAAAVAGVAWSAFAKRRGIQDPASL